MSNPSRSNGLLGEAGSCAFSLVRFLAIIFAIYMLVALAGQWAQRAQQTAGESAAGLGQAAATGISGLFSSAAQAAYCALPLINCSTNNVEAFAQCLSSLGRPSHRCTPYDSVDDAAASALVLARLGTKCRDVEFAGLIYEHNVGGVQRISFVGPFAGQARLADFSVSVRVLEQLGVKPEDVKGAYHSHPADSWARFSLQDLATAATLKRPSYIVGTNTAGDGEVVRFTPQQPLPTDWQSGKVEGSFFDGFLYDWISWGAIRETWYDWVTPPPMGDIEPLGDLGNYGELVDRARQCPS